MKKYIMLFILFILCFHSYNAHAQEMIIKYNGLKHEYTGSVYSLKVNDEDIKTPMPPIIFNDYALVPVREVLESMGATVKYYSLSQQVFIEYNNRFLRLKINNNEVIFDDDIIYIPGDITPMLISMNDGEAKTMVPVRFVAEILGFEVLFDGETGTINIIKPDETTPSTIYSYKCSMYDEDTVTLEIKFDLPIESISSPKLTQSKALYFDIPNAKYSISNAIKINTGAIKNLRLGLHDGFTRVAIDLENYKKYKVTVAENMMSILITVNNLPPVVDEDEKEEDDEKEENTKYDFSDKLVIIDAGHGGMDPGAIGVIGNEKIDEDINEDKDENEVQQDVTTQEEGETYYEKDLNLKMAKTVRDILVKNDVNVKMTRNSDKYLALTERSDYANTNNAVIFVSIHVNSATTSTPSGFEVYYSLLNNDNVTGLSSSELATSISKSVSKKVSTRNRGVKTADHVVTKSSLMPAVLVEVGFISNPDELNLMLGDEFRQNFAQGIANGILSVLDQAGQLPEDIELSE